MGTTDFEGSLPHRARLPLTVGLGVVPPVTEGAAGGLCAATAAPALAARADRRKLRRGRQWSVLKRTYKIVFSIGSTRR